jgi:hypothetical protein
MANPNTNQLPHDWCFTNWPRDVFPYTAQRARHLVRQHQPELVKLGALTRVGRTLVVLGAGYQKWLASNTPRVTDFDVPANRPEHAHKRFGRARDAA